MELALLVYLLGMLKSLDIIVTLGVIISAIFFAVMLVTTGMAHDMRSFSDKYEREYQSYKGLLKKASISVCILTFVGLIIPSEKTAWMMVGGYAAQRIHENPNVQKLEEKMLKVIETKMDDIIEHGIKEAEKKAK